MVVARMNGYNETECYKVPSKLPSVLLFRDGKVEREYAHLYEDMTRTATEEETTARLKDFVFKQI